MGGLGSGRRRGRRRPLFDEAFRLDAAELGRGGQLGAATSARFVVPAGAGVTDVLELGPHDSAITCRFTRRRAGHADQVVEYAIKISRTECNFGGTRPWLLCPRIGCRRQVRALFFDAPYLSCRVCARLTYRSQAQKKAVRGIEKAKAIHAALGGRPGLVHPFPHRPKGMHRRRYDELRREVEALERAYMADTAVSFDRVAAYVARLVGGLMPSLRNATDPTSRHGSRIVVRDAWTTHSVASLTRCRPNVVSRNGTSTRRSGSGPFGRLTVPIVTWGRNVAVSTPAIAPAIGRSFQ